jgi:hypothetical protein
MYEFGDMSGDNLAANNFEIYNDHADFQAMGGFDQAGTSADPYQVANDYQLGLVGKCAGFDVYFLQTADINLSDFVGIGSMDKPFIGHYDGAGREINEAGRVYSADNQGLFNVIGVPGGDPTATVVENVNYNAVITQSGFNLNLGAFTSQVYSATIHNIAVTGSFTGQGQQIGAIAGLSDHAIFDGIASEMDFNLSSPYNMCNLGGLIGQVYAGTVDNAAFSGSMNVSNGGQYGNSVGGAFGYVREATVTHASSTAPVTYIGLGSKIGGLYGFAEIANFEASYATGHVDAEQSTYVGGFAGSHDTGEVKNSFSNNSLVQGDGYTGGMFGSIANLNLHDVFSRSSTVSQSSYAGALVGDIGSSQLQNIYSVGSVDAPNSDGGWFGADETGTTASSVFWVPSLVGVSANATPIDGSTTMTADQALTLDFYDQAGFNISDDGTSGYTWIICPSRNGGFPYLYKTSPNLNCVVSLTNTPTPTITGSGKVGVQLDAVPGNWDAGVGLTYQWKLDGVAISGAVASGYVPLASQVGKTLTVEVTGTKAGYPSVTKLSSNGIVVLAVAVTGGGDTAANPAVASTNGAYVTTGDSALSWNRAKGLLGFKILVQYTGPIKATLTFKSGSKNFTCAVSFGILKKQPKFKQTWLKSPNFCAGKKEKAQAAALKKIGANTTVKIVTVRELHTPATYKKVRVKNRTIYVKLG